MRLVHAIVSALGAGMVAFLAVGAFVIATGIEDYSWQAKACGWVPIGVALIAFVVSWREHANRR